MTLPQLDQTGSSSHDPLVERCRLLRVPCVQSSAGTTTLLTKSAEPALEALLRALPLTPAPAGRQPGEPSPLRGCHVVPLDPEFCTSPAPTFALVLCDDLVHSPDYPRLCAAAGLTPEAARAALTPWLQQGDDAADRVATMLGWLRDDAYETSRSAGLLQEFSNQLLQVYEEFHVLFRIMRVMSATGSVREQVQAVCNQIQQIFPFAWMCIQFKDARVVESRLRNQFILAGKTPVPIDAFRAEVDSLLADLAVRPSRVLVPGASGIATLVEAEVIVEPISHDNTLIGVLLIGNKSGPDPGVASPEIQFLDAAADFLGTFHENAMRFAEQRAMFLATVGALTATIDAKDPYTKGHSERVAHLTEQIALAIGQTEEQAARARIAGMVHDIGKIGVPDAVLCKNGRLTDPEFEAIKRHPEMGHRILKDIEPLQDILPGVLHHHERWDGRGYPHKIAGESIELVARMIGLADAFDAMSSNRSYRAGLSRDHVMMELAKGSGSQFDPALVEAFRTIDLTRYDEMVREQAPPTIIAKEAA